MSRSYCSYDEDWQRRKSILIRSLFHDIPILSPVQEESYESSDYIQPPTFDPPSRPYSPLPPLIIERIPIINKHDEPKEYYRKLLTKIKKIYRKLFIENIDLDSEDYNLCVTDDNSINNDYFIQSDESNHVNLDLNIADNQYKDSGDFDSINNSVRESSDSFNSNSNGYKADSEAMESDEIIDVVNYTKSNGDEEMRYEEVNSSTITTLDQEISETDGSSDVTNNHQENNEKEENYRKTMNEFNTIRIDCSEFRETEDQLYNVRMYLQERNHHNKSKAMKDDLQVIEVENSVNGPEKRKIEKSNTLKIDELRTFEYEKSSHYRISDYKFNKGDNSNNVGIDCEQINISDESCNIRVENRNPGLIVNKNESTLMETTSDEKIDRVVSKNAIQEDAQASSSDVSEGMDYRQITTNALIHVDGSQDAPERESRVYEDSVRSLILPTREFRRLVEARRVNLEDQIEELSSLEENRDPATTTFDTDGSGNFNQIEVMRTPQPRVSQESIPITRCTESDNTNEHTTLPPKPTAITSSSQNGGDSDMAELETTDDIHEVLASIFNKSQNKDEGSFSRKRKLHKDISVQTSEMVSWEEIRGNFFVGTPKIFRLCACVDHVCD